MNLFEEITSDARYLQGKQFIKDRKYEESINMFSSLLQSCNESHGETSILSARAYYEYGNALLIKEEEDPSDDLIGPRDSKSFPGKEEATSGSSNAAAEGKEEEQEEEEKDEENEADGEEEEEDKDGDAPAEEAEESDLQVAWEVLDLARVILEKENDSKYDALLSEVYIRLGDLMKMNDTLSSAIEEYSKALDLRSRITPLDHRIISNIHYLLAVAYIYQASEQKENPSTETRRTALQHYEQSKKFLQEYTQSSSSSSSADSSRRNISEEELKEVQELIDELKETIDALAAEIAEMEGQEKKKEEPLVSTTIGFGNSSRIEAQAPVVRAQEVTNLQVRKKQKTSHNTEQEK